MNWEPHQILITVKTYPTPSKKYVETVCVAGVSLSNKKFVRLYPIRYRDLDENKKFKKYSVIKAKIAKAADDHRPESYKINADSIEIIDTLGTKDKWLKRKGIVLPVLDKSMCEILKQEPLTHKSLGLIKPERIEFTKGKARNKDIEEAQRCYAQMDLINKQKQTIEFIPYEFRYKFYCAGEPNCPGHDFPIIDWEIGQSYRSWRADYPNEDVLLQKIKQRWFDEICSPNKDTYFYVGNVHRFRDTFMVLGVFYPPK
ncbi:MAG: hypothetical protein WC980_04315 [Candidatus Brocadiia bacterium]